ncbi:MAG: hypothetical protein KDE48_18250 [Anaerolineales bacterium]|nr:hypothetical protein [Anaerolineales bacterium]
MEINPFIYGRSLTPTEMVGRQQEMQFVLGRLVKRQSTAVVAPPHSGKTTFLQALADPATRQAVAGDRFANDIFSFVDAQAMQGITNQAAFWQLALQPLAAQIIPAAATELPAKRIDVEILNKLQAGFIIAEIRELSFSLNVDYENLPGKRKADKALELITFLKRRERLDELLTLCRQLRPKTQWPDIIPPIVSSQSNLVGVYQTAVNNQFGNWVLEQLFRKLWQNKQRFILLIDEFDDFLANKTLHTAEFYGGLRSLASRSPGLALIIATRRELETLNQLTQEINPHGSPYFNVFTEYHLGALSDRAMTQLLSLGQARFDTHDTDFVKTLSGQHPFLAQTAAAAVWDAHQQNLQGSTRYQMAGKTFFDNSNGHFADTWRILTTGQRRAVTAVALHQIFTLTNGQSPQPHPNFSTYKPDLDKLARSGFVAETDYGWMLCQQGFVWWLLKNLRATVQTKADFTVWLQQQGLDGHVSPKEKEWMGVMAETAVKHSFTYKPPAV